MKKLDVESLSHATITNGEDCTIHEQTLLKGIGMQDFTTSDKGDKAMPLLPAMDTTAKLAAENALLLLD